MEYPVIPNALASKSQMRKMQVVQNRNIRFIRKNTELENNSIKETHDQLQLEPINIRLFNAAEKLWGTFQTKEEITSKRPMAENYNNVKTITGGREQRGGSLMDLRPHCILN